MTSSFADDLLPRRNATVSFIKASSGKIPGSRGAQPGYGITGSPDKAQAAIREPLPGGAALTGATNRSGLVARIRRQSPSGKDAGLHRQHVLEHHPGGDRRADHPGHVRAHRVHQQEVLPVRFQTHLVGHPRCHRHRRHPGRANQRVDLVFTDLAARRRIRQGYEAIKKPERRFRLFC